MMKRETLPAGLASLRGFLLALALGGGLVLPFAPVSAQDEESTPTATTQALSEVPSTGARRPGPILLFSSGFRPPEPAPEAEEEPAREGVAPVAFQVDSAGIDAPIEVGSIVDGVMLDPSGPWVVSWYDDLGKVDQDRNVVMAGHIDYYNSGPDGAPGPAVFADVPELAAGEIIRLVGENGEAYEYAVEWTKMYNVVTELTPEVIQNDIVGDTGQESLTLITCGGDFDPATGQYLQRWVLRANRV
jgi:Sortase domain